MADPAQIAARIVQRLRDAGYEAWLVGGCVRDRLLGRTPLDFDVATSARPEAVRRLFRRTVPVGLRFGVVLVVDAGCRVEVATFRSDDAYIDGRHPSAVRYGSAAEDAQRRDFTINALLQDPFTLEVIDHVGGQADLRAGVVRAIGDPHARIREDRLRMLRAVRFAARFGFAIAPATLDAIRAAAPAVTDMAAERIGEEIVKMLCEGSARRAFELLAATSLLEVVLPEVAALRGVAQSPDHHPEGDAWDHTLLLLAQLPAGASETLGLAALLHDVGKPLCARTAPDGRIAFSGHHAIGARIAVDICQRLRRSRATWERVAYLVEHHLEPREAPAMRLATLKRMLAAPAIDELLHLARLDALASNRDLGPVLYCLRRRRELGPQALRPPRLLGGSDLLALGVPPGPALGKLLRALEDAQLEGEVTSREAAEAFVREHLAGCGLRQG